MRACARTVYSIVCDANLQRGESVRRKSISVYRSIWVNLLTVACWVWYSHFARICDEEMNSTVSCEHQHACHGDTDIFGVRELMFFCRGSWRMCGYFLWIQMVRWGLVATACSTNRAAVTMNGRPFNWTICENNSQIQFGIGEMVWQLFFAKRKQSARRIACNTLLCVSLMVLSYYRCIIIGFHLDFVSTWYE